MTPSLTELGFGTCLAAALVIVAVSVVVCLWRSMVAVGFLLWNGVLEGATNAVAAAGLALNRGFHRFLSDEYEPLRFDRAFNGPTDPILERLVQIAREQDAALRGGDAQALDTGPPVDTSSEPVREQDQPVILDEDNNHQHNHQHDHQEFDPNADTTTTTPTAGDVPDEFVQCAGTTKAGRRCMGRGTYFWGGYWYCSKHTPGRRRNR